MIILIDDSAFLRKITKSLLEKYFLLFPQKKVPIREYSTGASFLDEVLTQNNKRKMLPITGTDWGNLSLSLNKNNIDESDESFMGGNTQNKIKTSYFRNLFLLNPNNKRLQILQGATNLGAPKALNISNTKSLEKKNPKSDTNHLWDRIHLGILLAYIVTNRI